MRQRILVYGLLALLGLGVLWGLGRWDGWIAERDRALDRQTSAALTLAKQWRTAYAEVAKEAQLERQRAQAAQAEARRHALRGDSLAALVQALEPSLVSAGTAQDSARICCRLFALRTDELAAARAQLDAHDVALGALMRERDGWQVLADSAYQVVIPGLEQALQAERDARRCRMLFVPCPSRGTVAAVTAVVTTVVVLSLND